ncbi:MAG: methyltransferase domain-containing protein [Gammaproteobacteria bacterium]|nr:methyltransferase domain-containing protein [Gammaproteobacteria bacterium]
MNKPTKLNSRDLRQRFERAARSFDTADFVHAVTREGLMTRLDPVAIEANVILDLGSATGSADNTLRSRFRPEHIIALDISRNMLRQSIHKRSWLRRFSFCRSSHVQADASCLPLADQSIDLVFCNLLLPFIDNPGMVFNEVARVLTKGGVFAFATLGPDSLAEISRAWNTVDDYSHVNVFPDMHDIGDALVQSGLRDPVLDVDRLTIQYDDPAKLFADLANVGGRNALQHRNRSMVGKKRFEKMLAALMGSQDNGGSGLELGLELVYGHCWGGGAKSAPLDYRIDVSGIGLRRS